MIRPTSSWLLPSAAHARTMSAESLLAYHGVGGIGLSIGCREA